jgi:hypothetical protein
MIVAMLVIGWPVQPRFQKLDPVLRLGTAQPTGHRRAARSFKTDAARLATIARHAGRLRRARFRYPQDEKEPLL